MILSKRLLCIFQSVVLGLLALNAQQKPIQEKVYLQFDNSCYYLGERLFYAAHVVRADDLRPTHQSAILYVELLSPEGFVVERQRMKLNEGRCHNSFLLKDTLDAGFYEVRAYTAWMLNFACETDSLMFEFDNEELSFFRPEVARQAYQFNGSVFSRVFPIYDQVEKGNYAMKGMKKREPLPGRPIRHLPDETLHMRFFPEGGKWVLGCPSQMAFEIRDKEGKWVHTSGTIEKEGKTVQTFRTEHRGKGSFLLTPEKGKYTAKFTYQEKKYSFKLPQPEESGIVMQAKLVKDSLEVQLFGNNSEETLGLTIACRGIIYLSKRMSGNHQSFYIGKLPTGVNQLTLFNQRWKILAERFFFINHHEREGISLSIDSLKGGAYQPYEWISLSLSAKRNAFPLRNETFALSVYDKDWEAESYSTGNLFTNLLLTSDLKGFIENPEYYFEKDDSVHQRHLDLLLLVQGWRRYEWKQACGLTEFSPFYRPEKNLSISGYAGLSPGYSFKRQLKKDTIPLTLDAELVHDDIVQKLTLKVDSNHLFYTDLQPIQGPCRLLLNARETFGKKKDKYYMPKAVELVPASEYPSEVAYLTSPFELLTGRRYYIMLDQVHGPLPKQYNYYETHAAELAFKEWEQEDAYALEEVVIKKKGSDKTHTDYDRPTLKVDYFEEYNRRLDLGCTRQLGEMFNDSVAESFLHHFYGARKSSILRLDHKFLNRKLPTRRLYPDSIYYFINLEGRTRFLQQKPPVYHNYRIYYTLKSKPDEWAVCNRNTHYDGYSYVYSFYAPDYSEAALPSDSSDYRRTLYWNPEVTTDAAGKATVEFYNNSRTKRIGFRAEGITRSGLPFVYQPIENGIHP